MPLFSKTMKMDQLKMQFLLWTNFFLLPGKFPQELARRLAPLEDEFMRGSDMQGRRRGDRF